MKQTIFVFDLDGVITDPENSSVDMVTVKRIHTLLEENSYVAVNTGRSYEWVKDNLLDALRDLGVGDLFEHLYIVCEKGGESLLWNGDDFYPQPSRFALPEDAMKICKNLFDENKTALNTMFWDATKRTMATVEKYPEVSLAEFHEQQAVFSKKLADAFAGHDVRIDNTTIAIDVEQPSAGKHAGAELIYEWVARHPETEGAAYICFGDSKSDYEMARYFAQQSVPTTFVFVGKKDTALDEHDEVQLIRTDAMYANGTREYFQM